MTDDVKKAAEEYAEERWKFCRDDTRYEEECAVEAFLAGDAHGFARAVKMLRSERAIDMYRFCFNPPPFSMSNRADLKPTQWANWLEEQEE